MLKKYFDAVVMLTWSDWYTEPRSNRYHYARRFSQYLPVVFVQPDLIEESYRYESTELENVQVLHLYKYYGRKQTGIFQSAMREKRIIRPLLWTYNCLCIDILMNQYSPLKIYHATEDYFSDYYQYPSGTVETLKRVLEQIDLLVTVSQGVRDSYHQKGYFRVRSIVLTNGCDYHFMVEMDTSTIRLEKVGKKVIYQGGINSRLDIALLINLVQKLSDWEFLFCGRVTFSLPESASAWERLCCYPNVKYLGELSPVELRNVLHQSSVGIIPYEQKDYINRSLPLKAFEYAACGLPVVTVPIESLSSNPEIFQFAKTADEFSAEIRNAETTRYDINKIKIRQEEARKKDYDENFKKLIAEVHNLVKKPAASFAEPLNILILYDKNSIHVPTVREHLESFSRFSEHDIFYMHASTGMNATEPAECPDDLVMFDAVVIHYSVRLSLTWHLSESFAEKLRNYGGFKVLFIQDEYDFTNTAGHWIADLGLHLVFTCVPSQYVDAVYPKDQFPHVEFIQTLTGYVPLQAEGQAIAKPHQERRYVIGYRGRVLPYWYGKLGYEKFFIGKRMREICEAKNIRTSIEWEDTKRIYGDDWYKFLEDCNATLGTESGSNIFDFDGGISRTIQAALQKNPDLTFEQIFEFYLKEHEGKVIMNQISPKIFEAVAMRTALVLFEGDYSGVVKPNEHYIPLKKDFGNVDHVLAKLQDHRYLTEVTERAYRDIIVSGKYSYREFIRNFDLLILERLHKAKGTTCTTVLIGYHESKAKDIHLIKSGLTFSKPVQPDQFQLKKWTMMKLQKKMFFYWLKLWLFLPYSLRLRIKPVIKPLASRMLGRSFP